MGYGLDSAQGYAYLCSIDMLCAGTQEPSMAIGYVYMVQIYAT